MTSGERRTGLLEVVALHAQDAESAQLGGADRIQVCAWADGEPRSVEPAEASAVVRATDLPVRMTLRLSRGFTTQGGEFTRMLGLVSDYLSLGVAGFSFGFLTPDLEIDTDVCTALAGELGGSPWTFDRAFDHALDLRHASRQVQALPGLDSVHTAGAVLGMDSGLDELIALASSDPAFAGRVVAAGGVRPEHVPWLARAGVTQLHLGASVRPGGSWTKAHVDAGFVRSWRLLLDTSLAGMTARSDEAG